jgi:hypothetical protein
MQARRARVFAAIDREVERQPQLTQRSDAAERRGAVTESARYVFGPFLREGECVHCHDGQTRAAELFRATPKGLRTYVETKGGQALWRRLAIRAIESRWSASAREPGMPMTRAPLSEKARAQVRAWVEAGCPGK